MVTVDWVVPIVVVYVVTPVPMVRESVRVGGFVVESQLLTELKHWHCKAGSVDKPVYSCKTMLGKLTEPQETDGGGPMVEGARVTSGAVVVSVGGSVVTKVVLATATGKGKYGEHTTSRLIESHLGPDRC